MQANIQVTGTHQPERFKEYTEAEDGSGFFLDDGTFFKFDKYNGWLDEFNNYYDSNGNPAPPPELDDPDDLEDDEEDNPEIAEIENAMEDFNDDLIDEYEEGAKLPDHVHFVEEGEEIEVDEFDEEAEKVLYMEQEREVIQTKVKKLIELGYKSISCIVIPKLTAITSSIVEAVGNLGFKISAPKLIGANYHFDIEISCWETVLEKVFEMSFFEKYSFHLENDIDDAPPVPTISSEPKVRKRLLKTSQVFIPPTATAGSPADKPTEPPVITAPVTATQQVNFQKPAEPKKDGKRARLQPPS